MKVMGFCLLICLLSLSAMQAQEVLNNDSIIKMVKAGLTEDVILDVINAKPGQYSLNTDDLIALKTANVPSKVIAAMISKSQGGSSTALPPPPPSGASDPGAAKPPVSEVGVYFKKGDAWTDVQPEVVNWKTGGVLKSIGSAGIVKGDVNGRVNGTHSPNLVRTPLEFLIYTQEGVAITEYQLLRLRDQKDAREFRTVTGGVFHVSGGATRDLLQFESKKIAPRTYVITLTNIKSGEYGFLPPGAAVQSHASATLGKIYSFQVLE